MTCIGVGKASALGIQDGVEAGYEHVGGMRATNVSLTRANTSPGEEEPKAWAPALSMLEVASATNAAGIPLPVASPITTPSRPSSRSKKS